MLNVFKNDVIHHKSYTTKHLVPEKPVPEQSQLYDLTPSLHNLFTQLFAVQSSMSLIENKPFLSCCYDIIVITCCVTFNF